MILKEEARKKNVQLGIDFEELHPKLPDSEWMLAAISTLNEHHPIFAKNYVYQKKKKSNKLEVSLIIKDDFKFF